jgi:hypothetical protein
MSVLLFSTAEFRLKFTRAGTRATFQTHGLAACATANRNRGARVENSARRLKKTAGFLSESGGLLRVLFVNFCLVLVYSGCEFWLVAQEAAPALLLM